MMMMIWNTWPNTCGLRVWDDSNTLRQKIKCKRRDHVLPKRGQVDCQKVKWHQTDMQIPKSQILWYYFRFLWWHMCVESLDMKTNHYLQSSHGGRSPSGCLPLPCSHHGGPNRGWGLGAWGSWRILGLLQTNSWDSWGVWGKNSHCCVKISTKGWNDYLHKKRESESKMSRV